MELQRRIMSELCSISPPSAGKAKAQLTQPTLQIPPPPTCAPRLSTPPPLPPSLPRRPTAHPYPSSSSSSSFLHRFVDAACFSSPVTNSKLVFPMDLSLFLNRLLFLSVAEPGISEVLMKVIDLEGTAIRCRGASEMVGPDGKVGSMIGKTFKDILLNTRLEGTIIIGVNSGDRSPDAHDIGGVAPRPDYVVQKKVHCSIFASVVQRSCGITRPLLSSYPATTLCPHYTPRQDWIIFLSNSSLPKYSSNPDDHKDYAEILPPRDQITRVDARRSLALLPGFEEQPPDMHEPQRVLLCGWRPVWTTIPTRLLVHSAQHDITM